MAANADLVSFVSEIRESLPRLRAKQSKSREAGGLEAAALQAEIHLRENILVHYDQLPRDSAKESELIQALQNLHEGVQHCAQSEIDRASDVENNEEVFACLGALADLDDRLVRLGATKPSRDGIRGERHTSD